MDAAHSSNDMAVAFTHHMSETSRRCSAQLPAFVAHDDFMKLEPQLSTPRRSPVAATELGRAAV